MFEVCIEQPEVARSRGREESPLLIICSAVHG
jgi:hypothetical protein